MRGLQDRDMESLSDVLIRWYEANRRELPWRETRDPYLIWVSEVILQQTRVAQGLGYYNRFVGRFPDARALAEADEDEVMRYWQGLGYYSRARNLHAAAKEVVERFGGVFPREPGEVLSLRGVGTYTAAAICSFAFDEPYATVDGNVYRVLARLFGVDLPIDGGEGRRYFAELAQELLDKRRPGAHNQALMEFGALQCVPRSPDCGACPLADRCRALAEGRVGVLPVKAGRTRTRERYFHYFDIRRGEKTLLAKRTGNDIWRNLYEFPLVETEAPLSWEELRRTEAFRALFDGVEEACFVDAYEARKHVLSHQVIHAVFYRVEVSEFPRGLERYARVERKCLGRYAVSRLMESYLEKVEQWGK